MQELDRFRLPAGFRGRNAIIVQAWWIVEGSLFRWSPQFLYGWRSFLLRLFGAKLGASVKMRPSVQITYPWKLNIGSNSWIGDDVVLYTLGSISIGSNTVVSQKSYLCAADHDYKDSAFSIRERTITIGDGVWIAADVFVGPGVSVDNDVVVGARSSVFTDLPSGYICKGNPCQPMRPRYS
jgi:putative colanic acid biosynthesis acetyltransferase WcaF